MDRPRSLRYFSRTISYYLIDYNELGTTEKRMLKAALRARKNAQASYSNYKVGASVMSEGKHIYSGCNVEGADFEAIHAEANAIGSMVAKEGPVKIIGVALVGAPAEADINILSAKVSSGFCQFVNIAVPCGGCLQRIWENCHGDAKVKIYSFSGLLNCISVVTMGDVLPLRFGPADLGIEYRKS